MKSSTVHPLSRLALLPCLLSAGPVLAIINCSPSISATTVRPGEEVSLLGNCIDTDTNLPPPGAEIWGFDVGDGGFSEQGRRNLPNGTLTVNAPMLPGEHIYRLRTIDQGYGGSIDLSGRGFTVAVTVAESAAASGQATLGQLTTPLTTLQTSRTRSHLNQAQARLRMLRASRTTPQFDVQGVPLPEGKKEAGDSTREQRLGVYIAGLGDRLRQKNTPNQSEFTARTTSVSVGADYRLNDAWVMGANAGVSDSRIGYSSLASKQESTGTQATAYASWSPTPTTYLSAALSYEASKFDLTRDDGNGQLSFASPRGRGLGFSLSGGRDFSTGPWSFGPYVRWDSVNSRINAFDETGSPSAVAMGSQSLRSDTLNLGAQTQFSVPVSWGVMLPFVRMELSHRNDKTRQAATATLLSGNTPLLLPTATNFSDTYGTVGLGVSGVNQGGMSWFVDYESGLKQNGYRNQHLGLGLRFEL